MATTKKTMEELAAKKAEEASNRMVPNNAEWYEKQSRKILKEHNITSKKEQDKYIGTDGKLNTDGHKKINFKGSPEDGIDDSILASDPELARDLRELQSIDTSLSPELQEYRDLPDFDNPRELLEYFIGDELPDDVILDWDLWSVLETMWEELLDIGDWL